MRNMEKSKGIDTKENTKLHSEVAIDIERVITADTFYSPVLNISRDSLSAISKDRIPGRWQNQRCINFQQNYALEPDYHHIGRLGCRTFKYSVLLGQDEGNLVHGVN